MIILFKNRVWSDHFKFRNASYQNSSLIRLSGSQKILNTTMLAVTNFFASLKNSHFMSDARMMCAQQSLIKYGLVVLSVGANALSYKKNLKTDSFSFILIVTIIAQKLVITISQPIKLSVDIS